jgi:hypothetical protein|nr:MAG TPA: hypothetical protein [Crassvirales sp.]
MGKTYLKKGGKRGDYRGVIGGGLLRGRKEGGRKGGGRQVIYSLNDVH